MGEVCLCGLEGENCDTLVPPLVSFDAVKACVVSTTEECIVNVDSVECLCKCGFEGDLCEALLDPLAANYILGYLIAFSLSLLSIKLILRYESLRQDDDNMFKVNFISSRLSFASENTLLYYRAACFIIFWPIAVEFSIIRPQDFLSFSLISWVLFGFYFFIGFILSLKAYDKPPTNSERVSLLEDVFIIIQSIVLPCALILTLVYWIVIVPSEVDNDEFDQLVRPAQFFVHGLNILMLSFDFYLNDTFFIKFHYLYVVIFTSLYLAFHQTLIGAYIVRDEPPCPIYDFLDLSLEVYLVFVFGLLFAFIGSFFIFYWISNKKKQYTPLVSQVEQK